MGQNLLPTPGVKDLPWKKDAVLVLLFPFFFPRVRCVCLDWEDSRAHSFFPFFPRLVLVYVVMGSWS